MSLLTTCGHGLLFSFLMELQAQCLKLKRRLMATLAPLTLELFCPFSARAQCFRLALRLKMTRTSKDFRML